MLFDDRDLLRLAKSWLVRSWSLPRMDEAGRGVATWEGILWMWICVFLFLLFYFWMF